MAATYTTIGGEVLDQICHRHYGKTQGTVERVLNANRGLADHLILPAGLTITLPDLPAESSGRNPAPVRLWD